MTDKSIHLNIEAPYSIYGELNVNTHTIWVVCHGYGQLARRFIRRFDILDPQKHFVIAPQGLSKFYLPGHQNVGATWMTKENRLVEIENYLNYIDTVFQTEISDFSLNSCKLNLLGFSQGVTTIARWACYRKVPFDQLIAWAGGFPHELQEGQFPLPKIHSKILAVLGKQDEFMDEKKLETELNHVENATNFRPEVLMFEGKHELKREVLKEVLEKLN